MFFNKKITWWYSWTWYNWDVLLYKILPETRSENSQRSIFRVNKRSSSPEIKNSEHICISRNSSSLCWFRDLTAAFCSWNFEQPITRTHQRVPGLHPLIVDWMIVQVTLEACVSSPRKRGLEHACPGTWLTPEDALQCLCTRLVYITWAPKYVDAVFFCLGSS